MRIPRVRYSVLGMMIVIAVVGMALGGHRMYRDRLRSLEREAANRAIARKQLVLIDEAWEVLEFHAQNIRLDIIDGGIIGQWGRRRLEALRKAGAGKAEIVAALEKYIKDLERMQGIVDGRHTLGDTPEREEIRFLRLEAEIWLNEEKAR